MYLPASKYVINFVSSIIKHSLIYTAQDQNYICIHIKILPHVILCNSYTLELHPILYTYLHTLINTYQSVSRFIRWSPRVRSVTCFKMSTSKVILYFYCLSRYVVIQSHINFDMIKTTIFELHYVLCNILLCVIYVESPLPHFTHSMKSQRLTFLLPISIVNMPTCSCELCTCLYILYKWVLDKIFFSYIDYNLIASYSIGSTPISLHARPSHFKYCYFPTQIKLLITSMQFLWSVNYLSNKMDTLPHPLFPISLYDLLLTFFEVLVCLIILTQNVIPLIFQMIFPITYRITQTISSYMTHVYFMDIYFKLYAWIIFISPFFKIIAKKCMLSYFIVSQNDILSCPSCIYIDLLCVSPFVYRFEEEKPCWVDEIDYYKSYYPP